MNPVELLQAVERYLDAPDAAALPVLTQAATDLADMVGWAPGPIDPEGLLNVRFLTLQESLRERYSARPDASVAGLHDALGALGDAIVRHDLDLTSRHDADDDEAFPE